MATNQRILTPVCAAIAAVMEDTGCTHRLTLANAVNLTETTITNYVNGGREPNAARISKLEIAMGVAPGTIYSVAAEIASEQIAA